MKKNIAQYLFLFLTLFIVNTLLTGCDNDNPSNLHLGGSTKIVSMKLGGYDAEIDNSRKTILVGVPVDCDITNLEITELTLEANATADLKVGERVNFSMPRSIKVTNGDVYTNYTITVKHDNVEVLSASLNNLYAGTIDNSARTIMFFVPIDADVTAMSLHMTLNEGAAMSPESGSVLDFTDPVEVTTTYRTASIVYTINVIKDEMSQEPKAFVGNADDVESLGNEAKAAAKWMIANVPNVTFVSVRSIIDGSVKLGDFKMIWCHLDFSDWPSVMWDSRDFFNDYYIKGGNILATRDGARYINDVWRIAKDQQSPNNMYGGDVYETLEGDLGFSITGHESHPIYDGLIPDAGGRILLASKGCTNSNRTLQWCTDWDAYGSMDIWREKTGAIALGSTHDFDANRVTVAEFEPRAILDGYQSGRVITIGTPAYEWYISNGRTNDYEANIVKLTKNAINYLCK